ncbi:MAG TPA: flagellar basal body L-ring protein FlgH [Noviherbaspirillum sp.]|nr:flagellar basal body L-ring protein FlgH [Noviherbaspirillum sp.]
MSRLLIVLLACAAVVSSIDDARAASLYQERWYQPLASDRKAHRPGDLITVLVYENASATSAANTVTGRDANVAFDLDGISTSRSGGFKTNNHLDGRGRTQREGRVLAQITATVREIADNGDLFIAGEHVLEVNNEKQQIRVEGRIRLQDISDANTVLSTRLADARISYVGDGDLSERQRPGWWQKILTWFGL